MAVMFKICGLTSFVTIDVVRIFVNLTIRFLTTHKKNAHLTKEERVMIATLKSQGLSNRAIGCQLGVNHQTINNELNRGTVRQLRRQKSNGKMSILFMSSQ